VEKTNDAKSPTMTRRFVFLGLVIAAIFFAASLTPSLLPRHYAVQGALSGFAMAAGYAIGWTIIFVWHYLELPMLNAKVLRGSRIIAALFALAVLCVMLPFATYWQNSIRDRMKMPLLESSYPVRVALISMLVCVGCIFITRLFCWCWLQIHARVERYVPRRVSYVLSSLSVVVLVFLLVNDLIAKSALRAADKVFLKLDQLVDEGMEQPTRDDMTGSASSAIDWDMIGRRGKEFVALGPTAATIEAITKRPSKDPIRVYVGLGGEEEDEVLASQALAELKRVGGFDRKLLIVSTPTGTGWLDPGAVDTVEYLHDGDTAIVSIQYSYLPSWLTILVDPDRSKKSAKALFNEVYQYWTTLPKDKRPKLYLQGLSLGSLGAETSADLFTIFADPIHGGVFSGPPFPSTLWNSIIDHRNKDSLMWNPTFRDGSMVRFMSQTIPPTGKADWGPMRFVYIQYASDPMVYFSPSSFYREPAWVRESRGPDVSPYVRWWPIVTGLQLLFDLPMATSIPTGFGHNYSPIDYLHAWHSVTIDKDDKTFDEATYRRIEDHFKTSIKPGKPD
jgi:uncharacterized membrane protein